MKTSIDAARKVFRRIVSSEKYKYSILIYSIATVHMVLIALFCYLHILPLIIFNIISVITYLSCAWAIHYDCKLIRIFYIVYAEIIAHSIISTICIGWQFGFPQYIIALIPFGYYMCHSLIDGRRKYLVATLLGIAGFISYIGCRIISLFSGAVYEINVSTLLEFFIYGFNTVCTFVFLLIFSLIFVYEMQNATNKLSNQNAILEKLASTDPLTSLYNRRSMQIFLNHALESGSDFCIFMCDIDNFKKINDTYGHDFGDEVLKVVSSIIQEQVEDYDYVCRWGGEEILVLSNNSTLTRSCQIAENVRRNIANNMFHNGDKIIHCSVTIGVASHQKNETVEDTITKADANLYYGKRNGKNRVVS
ncbi:MAG: GGDEF domain-containing protein [Lachnospiraceae bacterium]|nr:GGDEF domain-containing protein [Lachnospiraceae bacterium]